MHLAPCLLMLLSPEGLQHVCMALQATVMQRVLAGSGVFGLELSHALQVAKSGWLPSPAPQRAPAAEPCQLRHQAPAVTGTGPARQVQLSQSSSLQQLP